MMKRLCLVLCLLTCACPASGSVKPQEFDFGFITSRLEDPDGNMRLKILGPIYERALSTNGAQLRAVRPFYSSYTDPRTERHKKDIVWPIASAERFRQEFQWRVLLTWYIDFDRTDPKFAVSLLVACRSTSRAATRTRVSTWRFFLSAVGCATSWAATRSFLSCFPFTHGATSTRWRPGHPVADLLAHGRQGDLSQEGFPLLRAELPSRPVRKTFHHVAVLDVGALQVSAGVGHGVHLVAAVGPFRPGGPEGVAVHSALDPVLPRPAHELQLLSVAVRAVELRRDREVLPVAALGEEEHAWRSERFFLWPIFRTEQLDRGDTYSQRFLALPFIHSEVRKERSHDPAVRSKVVARHHKIWPLLSYKQEGENKRFRVLDLWPLKDTGPVEREYAPIWTLYSHTLMGNSYDDELLWGLYRCRKRGSEYRSVSLFPRGFVDAGRPRGESPRMVDSEGPAGVQARRYTKVVARAIFPPLWRQGEEAIITREPEYFEPPINFFRAWGGASCLSCRNTGRGAGHACSRRSRSRRYTFSRARPGSLSCTRCSSRASRAWASSPWWRMFTGMILALQTGLELRRFGQEVNIGTAVTVVMLREMGPFMTGLIIAASVGSAIAAQMGTMVVSEEIAALEIMSINPVRFLVMPRLVALAVMMPVLTVYTNIIGIVGRRGGRATRSWASR